MPAERGTDARGTDRKYLAGEYRHQVPVGTTPSGWNYNSPRPPVIYHTQVPGVDQARYLFSRTNEGRHFDNGIYLRPGRPYEFERFHRYFPRGYAFYPYYSPTFEFGVVYYSPYAYYSDLVPLYIYRSHCHYYPPTAVYISIPIYRSSTWCGWADDSDYYLYSADYRPDSARLPEGLSQAIAAIEDAFGHDDVMPLVDLTDPTQQISVFRRGQYDYSMDANDYLDVTRDAMQSIHTVSFKIDHVRRKADDVWSLAGRHVYRDRDGNRRTVYVSYVLEMVRGRWTITQVGSAPDRLN